VSDGSHRSAHRSRRRGPRHGENLAEVVLRLSDELAGLRRAQRSRTVIEQAKGVLMERLHCTPEQAFEQLVGISQQVNTKVVEVAAGLLGLTSPVQPQPAEAELLDPAPSGTGGGSWTTDPSPPQLALPDQDVARYHLTCAAMSTATDGHQVADALLADGLRALGATGVLLAVVEADGAVRVVGARGLSRGLVSAWQRVPGALNVAFLKAVAEGRTRWLDRSEATRSGLQLLGPADFRACVPMRSGGRVSGVAVVLWDRFTDLDATRRAYVQALAAAAGRRLAQLRSDRPGAVASPAAHWLEAILDVLPGSFALLRPVTDGTGRVVDWCFDLTSHDAVDALGRPGEQLIGRRLLELHPSLAGSEIMRGYERVLRTGEPFGSGPREQKLEAQAHPVILQVRATRLGEGILITWRHDDPAGRLLDRIHHVQQATGAGWAEWNLQTGEARWAPETQEILDVAQPVHLQELRRCVVPEDAAVIASIVHTVTCDHEAAEGMVRVPRAGRPAPVRVVAEPVLDGQGRLLGVRAAVHRVPADAPIPSPSGTGAVLDDCLPPSPAAQPPPAARPDAAARAVLAATAQRLRTELDHVRRSQHAHAVVAQAKGMLAARLGCPVEDTAEHLARMSRRRGLPLVELAAEIVGAPVPVRVLEERTREESAFRPERYVGHPAQTGVPPDPTAPRVPADQRFPRAASAMAAARDGDALAAAVWAHGLRELGATAVLLGVLEPDGAVRLVGTHGLAAPLVSAWRRTPSSVNVAYLRAVATETPLWISREEAARRGYQLLGEGDLRACLPLHEAGRIFGVASVLWNDRRDLDAATKAQVQALVEACGRRLSDLLRRGAGPAVASPAAHWAETVIAALPPSYALLRPVRDTVDAIVDWRFESLSPATTDVAGREAAEIIGHDLRDLYPHADISGIVDTYTAALLTGATATWGPAEVDVITPSGPVTVTMSVRASRFGDGVLVHWRHHDEQRRLAKRLDLLERVADCGWAEWDLLRERAAWSATTYKIMQRDPARGPVKLGALHRYVAAQDEAAATEAVQTLTRHRRPIDCLVHLRRHGRAVLIRLTAEPVLDPQGQLTAVRAVIQRRSGA
jgi:AmiR/NasT family two-component response regulator